MPQPRCSKFGSKIWVFLFKNKPAVQTAVFTLKFTHKNQQIGKVYTKCCKCTVAVKNTNDNLNTHDFEY